MSQNDGFVGAWRVSEYVFTPDGRFIGTIQQRRELRRLDNGRMQLLQQCEPSETLAGHPMEQFSGEHIFELHVDGRVRRYLGPAVIGSGLPWGEGAMTGRGLWPHFGHNFTSFAVLAQPNRQLTGGKFFNATEMIANIIGVAVPETAETKAIWPVLNIKCQSPSNVAPKWIGSLRSLDSGGDDITEQPLQRSYQQETYQEALGNEGINTIGRQPLNGYDKVCGRWQGQAVSGLAKQYGPLYESELVVGSDYIVETMELFDSETNSLIGLRRWLRDHQLEKVEVFRLRPHHSP